MDGELIKYNQAVSRLMLSKESRLTLSNGVALQKIVIISPNNEQSSGKNVAKGYINAAT